MSSAAASRMRRSVRPCLSRGARGAGAAGRIARGRGRAAARSALGRGGGAALDPGRCHHAGPGWAPSPRSSAVRDWLRFHCATPFCAANEAMFAIGTWDAVQPLDRFAIGTPDYPDRSATLIVEHIPTLTGPTPACAARNPRRGAAGTAGPCRLRRQPRALSVGVDVFLTAGDRIAGLPRSTIVEAL